MIFFFLLLHPMYYLRPSILSLLVVTQIRGHIAGSFPPLPTTVRALHFYREKISALSSLVDSRRIVLTHARRSQQLILLSFFFANRFIISPRRDSNSRTNTSSIRGLPLVHRGDRCLTINDTYQYEVHAIRVNDPSISVLSGGVTEWWCCRRYNTTFILL